MDELLDPAVSHRRQLLLRLKGRSEVEELVPRAQQSQLPLDCLEVRLQHRTTPVLLEDVSLLGTPRYLVFSVCTWCT